MTFMLTVPTHLDGRNPIVGRYTARDLVPVVAGMFGAAGVLGQPHLLAPVRIGEALAVVALGGATGILRPGGRSLVDWGRRATTHALGERSSVWAPPAPPRIRSPARCVPRRPATHAHPFVPVAIDDDTVTFTDGRRCAVLECGGANVEEDGPGATTGAAHRLPRLPARPVFPRAGAHLC